MDLNIKILETFVKLIKLGAALSFCDEHKRDKIEAQLKKVDEELTLLLKFSTLKEQLKQ